LVGIKIPKVEIMPIQSTNLFNCSQYIDDVLTENYRKYMRMYQRIHEHDNDDPTPTPQTSDIIQARALVEADIPLFDGDLERAFQDERMKRSPTAGKVGNTGMRVRGTRRPGRGRGWTRPTHQQW
jgi:hypothetical protein